MNKRAKVFVFVVFLVTVSGMSGAAIAYVNANNEETKKFAGLCYGPYRDNEAPGYYPTIDEMREDIYFLKNLTYAIRTYSVRGNLSEIPRICEEVGIDCYPCAWISENKKINEMEINRLISVANQNMSCVKGLIVGSEVLLRGDLTEDELIEYIKQVKNRTTLPVTTAETWNVWVSHPRLAENVDFILVHILPYWEGIHVNDSAEYVVERWEYLNETFGKEVIIGETGWPSEGNINGLAVPSEENQMLFLSEFKRLADERGINYFYFEAFDERWKILKEGEVGGHWGIYLSNGSIKHLLKEFVPEDAREGFEREERDRHPGLPCFVYKDAYSPENRFIPSGWMGDLENWLGDPQEVIDEACYDNPQSGETCIRIRYTPGWEGWGGIYWQFPENNWGDLPGYNLSGALKLVFWARGENGTEKAEFKTGGISVSGKKFKDSFGPLTTGVIRLTKEWKKYEISLEGENLSMVIGGFCWVTNRYQNPEGCTIYIDNISFVAPAPPVHEFDTGSPLNPYPSISGTHKGTIKPNRTIIATKLYTYPCVGTGGHTEYAKIWNETWEAVAEWEGYADDWHNITFDKTVALLAGETYYYEIKTGSYPQIHHTDNLSTPYGFIKCYEFIDVNNKKYKNWIPAIKLC